MRKVARLDPAWREVFSALWNPELDECTPESFQRWTCRRFRDSHGMTPVLYHVAWEMPLDLLEKFIQTLQLPPAVFLFEDVSIHSRPIRRLTPQPTDRGRADCPSLKGGVTKKDFIGSAVLSTSLFPLKVEVSNHKEIFDEEERFVMTSKLSTGPVRGAASS